MRKIFTIILSALLALNAANAQNSLNSKADNILGDYECFEKGNESRIHITKAADGSYTGTLFWVKDDRDPSTGDCWKDINNPDKSLRGRYVHSLSIINGLKYNADKKQWAKGKIYDPNRGITANCTAQFNDKGDLIIRGSILGIGESITWKRMK